MPILGVFYAPKPRFVSVLRLKNTVCNTLNHWCSLSCVIFWGCYGKILKYIDIEEEREVSCVCAYIGVCVHSIYIIFYKYIYYYYRDKTLPFNDLGVLRELIITVTGEL